MKICFVLQRRFVYVGHQLAVHLKERYGVNDFCAYVYLRPGHQFLKFQKDINYSSLLLEEDVHNRLKHEPLNLEYLKNLEKEYGIPNLWPFLEVDRIIRFQQLVREYPYDTPKYTHEEMMRLVQVYAKAIIKWLEQEKPDCVFFSLIGGLGSYLIYRIAQSLGIKTIIIGQTRIGTRHVLSERPIYLSWVDEIFEKLKKGKASSFEQEARALFENFEKSPRFHNQEVIDFYLNRTSRRAQLDFLQPNKSFRYLRWLLRTIKNYYFSGIKNDYSTVSPWNAMRDQIKRKFRILFEPSDLYDEPKTGEDFAYFPLHFEPEIATLFYAPFFTDQLWVIKQIAKSLPLHFKLYVKEHPAMVGYRSLHFYRELKKIPNVKLIHPSVKNAILLPEAKLVLTISGSAGWEALFFKKPVITFGDVFYNRVSMVQKITDITELPKVIQDQLANYSFNENEFIKFIAAILEDSVEVDLTRLWEREPDFAKKKEGIKPLADLLAQKLGLRAV